jgi:hypothetical protein
MRAVGPKGGTDLFPFRSADRRHCLQSASSLAPRVGHRRAGSFPTPKVELVSRASPGVGSRRAVPLGR